MDKIKTFFLILFGLLVVGPVNSCRIVRLGAQRVAEFRAEHGREPTEAEWQEISKCVEQEIFKSS